MSTEEEDWTLISYDLQRARSFVSSYTSGVVRTPCVE